MSSTETQPTYYAVSTGDGRFDLRQTRFKGRETEHPHDVCAAGFTADGMRELCRQYGFDADLSALGGAA